MNCEKRVILTARVVTLPGQLETVLEAARRCAAATRKEPGCVQYLLTVARDEPNVIQFMEIFRSAQDFQSHAKAVHTQEFGASLRGTIQGDGPVLTFFNEVDVPASL